MKRAFLTVLALTALALFAVPAATAQFDSMTMDAPQSYLRLGFNDTITVTVHLTDDGSPAGIANVPVALNFVTGGDYVVFGNPLIITDSSGTGSTTVMVNPENTPEHYRLPLQVMIQAIAVDNDDIRCNVVLYVTDTGLIRGYVVDDSMSTITGANITVLTPDGKVFKGGSYVSSDGSGNPMGYFQIDNLPLEVPGKNTLTAEKNGVSGSIRAEADVGYNNIMHDIVIHGFKDPVDVTSIINAKPNATIKPLPTPDSDTPAKPTTMTTTIIIAIILITLVYLGLKAYRRMF